MDKNPAGRWVLIAVKLKGVEQLLNSLPKEYSCGAVLLVYLYLYAVSSGGQ